MTLSGGLCGYHGEAEVCVRVQYSRSDLSHVHMGAAVAAVAALSLRPVTATPSCSPGGAGETHRGSVDAT